MAIAVVVVVVVVVVVAAAAAAVTSPLVLLFTRSDGRGSNSFLFPLSVLTGRQGFKLMGTEGRVDVGEFVGDFGRVHARLFRGNGRVLSRDPQVC